MLSCSHGSPPDDRLVWAAKEAVRAADVLLAELEEGS
jgi:hypothetical protein